MTLIFVKKLIQQMQSNFFMIDCYGFTPLDSFKSNSTHCKGGALDAFSISKNAVDNNFMKNLVVIVKMEPILTNTWLLM